MLSEKIIIGQEKEVIDEPEYAKIKGKWITTGDFLVLHRIVISENYLGRNLSKKILDFAEEVALGNNIFSIRVDTSHDNIAMSKIFKKNDYVYCGEIYIRGNERKAYEKALNKKDYKIN